MVCCLPQDNTAFPQELHRPRRSHVGLRVACACACCVIVPIAGMGEPGSIVRVCVIIKYGFIIIIPHGVWGKEVWRHVLDLVPRYLSASIILLHLDCWSRGLTSM